MEIQDVDIPLHPFLFMGCWNNRGPARNAVVASINANSVKNLVLAGDNVYPLSEDGKKHQIAVFQEGMKMLESKRILLSALGNHNIVGTDKVVEGLSLEAAQRNVFGMAPDAPRYFCKRFSDNMAIVVLDSNIMDDGAAVSTMAMALKEVLASLAASKTRYYLVQHEPFAAYKKPGKNHILPNGDIILHILTRWLPVAVLCADTHNYQEGVLVVGKTIINQVVVGTGGADPDRYTLDSFEPLAVSSDITYFINPEISLPSYGLHGYYQINSPSCGVFLPVVSWAAKGGRRYRGTRALRKPTRLVATRKRK